MPSFHALGTLPVVQNLANIIDEECDKLDLWLALAFLKGWHHCQQRGPASISWQRPWSRQASARPLVSLGRWSPGVVPRRVQEKKRQPDDSGFIVVLSPPRYQLLLGIAGTSVLFSVWYDGGHCRGINPSYNVRLHKLGGGRSSWINPCSTSSATLLKYSSPKRIVSCISVYRLTLSVNIQNILPLYEFTLGLSIEWLQF